MGEMMAVILGQSFGSVLAKQLGLPKDVRGFTIRVYVNEAVMITTEHYLQSDGGEAIFKAFRQYELYEKGEHSDLHITKIAEQWLQRVRKGKCW